MSDQSPKWSLETLLQSLHQDVEQRLRAAREAFKHSTTKGDGSESIWRTLLEEYLPERYRVLSGHVCDSQGHFSQQIDIIVLDRQYSPLIFQLAGQYIVPAESVYAIFEAKQAVNASMISYAQDKAETVRKLYRTSRPIKWLKGDKDKKELSPILAGILAFESDWSPALGDSLHSALQAGTGERRLEIGAVAAHGIFVDKAGTYEFTETTKAATAFLFKLIPMLQDLGTVPMIDMEAYEKWLIK